MRIPFPLGLEGETHTSPKEKSNEDSPEKRRCHHFVPRTIMEYIMPNAFLSTLHEFGKFGKTRSYIIILIIRYLPSAKVKRKHLG